MARAKTATALHMENGSVWLYQVRAGPKGLQVQRDARLDPAADTEPPQADWASLRKECGKNNREVVVGFPADAVLFRVLRLPATDPSELPAMLEVQIDKISPFPVDEVGWDYLVLEQGEDWTSVAVALARVDRIEENLAPLHDEGFEPVGVDLDVLGVHRWLQEAGYTVPDGWSGLIHCSDGHASLLVTRDGVPQALRPFPLSGEGADLDSEFARTLTAVAAETGHAPDQVVVIGGGSDRDRIAEAARRAGLAVDLPSAEDLPGSAAVGLAQRAIDSSDRRIDLLPIAWHRRRERKARLRVAVRALAAAAVLYVVCVAAFFQLIRMRQNRLRRTEAQAREIQPELVQARNYQRQNAAVSVFVNADHSGLEMLRLVTEQMPEGVSLTQFVFRKRQRVTVRGLAATKTDATQFLANLEGSGRFQEVKTSYIRDHKSRNSETAQQFEFVCGFETPETARTPTRPVRIPRS